LKHNARASSRTSLTSRSRPSAFNDDNCVGTASAQAVSSLPDIDFFAQGTYNKLKRWNFAPISHSSSHTAYSFTRQSTLAQ
jgi:hypothetical protein